MDIGTVLVILFVVMSVAASSINKALKKAGEFKGPGPEPGPHSESYTETEPVSSTSPVRTSASSPAPAPIPGPAKPAAVQKTCPPVKPSMPERKTHPKKFHIDRKNLIIYSELLSPKYKEY